jgi:uncharacterized protein YuzE
MNDTKNNFTYNYDREADVLYISFGRSDHVATVELSDHLLLRFDLGQRNGRQTRAIGITLLFPKTLLKQGHNPLQLQLDRIYRLPDETKSAVLDVLSKPPVSDILSAQLEFTPTVPPLPELLAA